MHVTLILFPGFPILSYALLRHALDAVALGDQNPLFTLEIRTLDGKTVRSADGAAVSPTKKGWDQASGCDMVALCAGRHALDHLPMGLRGFLHGAEANGATLAGFDGGATILAELGFLDTHHAVLPEADRPRGRRWPGILLAEIPFALDRKRLTCADGLAIGEAMLAWMAQAVSPALMAGIASPAAASQAGMAPWRPSAAPLHGASDDPLLRRMRLVMEANLSRPLALEEIAAALDLSPKQMRTRCQKGLGMSPLQAYLEIRLNRARHLVGQTELSVQEIAAATGFGSPSAFTRSYRAHFGETPRAQRAGRYV